MSEDRVFYAPEKWRAECLDKFYPMEMVNFDEVEEAMIRRMAHKFGCPREDIVREAVREFYVHVMTR